MNSINPKFAEFFNKLGARKIENKAKNEQSANAEKAEKSELPERAYPPAKTDKLPSNKRKGKAAGK